MNTQTVGPQRERVICLVPSWTEMLLECGVNVVGRTRFCVEPHDQVKQITVVGGTKEWNLASVEKLSPTLIVLDQEENPKSMSEKHSWSWLATHVTSVASCVGEIRKIIHALRDSPAKPPPTVFANLDSVAARWDICAKHPRAPMAQKLALEPSCWLELPGVVDWIRLPERPPSQILYMIWKHPWMICTQDTFIGSMLDKFGVKLLPAHGGSKYPEVHLEEFEPLSTLLLFSSEPYPFLQRRKEIEALRFPSALVDGQSWSWFGTRSLRFLEQSLLSAKPLV